MTEQGFSTQIRSFRRGRQRWVAPAALVVILAIGGPASGGTLYQCGD